MIQHEHGAFDPDFNRRIQAEVSLTEPTTMFLGADYFAQRADARASVGVQSDDSGSESLPTYKSEYEQRTDI